MKIYLDESGDTGSAPGFAVAMFFTKDPSFWEKVIKEIRSKEKYPFEFKFKKMQDNLKDGRVRFAMRLIDALLQNKRKFYVRALIVDRKLVDKARFGGSNQVEYNYFVESLVMHYTKRLTDDAKLILDFRQREREDFFIPEKLQSMLDIRSVTEKTKRVKIEIQDSKKEDLLQVADFLVGAVRQIYFPSKNRQKLKIARKLSTLIDNSIYIWPWKPAKK